MKPRALLCDTEKPFVGSAIAARIRSTPGPFVASPLLAMYRATAPVTWGAAMLVPLIVQVAGGLVG